MPIGYPGTKTPHGTITRYTSHGCRCDECQTARRAYYGQRPLEVVDAERAAQHGTESEYSHSKCRCEPCRAAATAARAARRAANVEAERAYQRDYYLRRKASA